MKNAKTSEINKRPLYFILVACILIAIIPYFIYFYKFSNSTLSDSKADWGTFGDFIAGCTSPVLSIVGVIITIYLADIANKYNETSLKNQERGIRPFGDILISSFPNFIEIKVGNHGLGPMKIISFKVFDKNRKEKASFLELIPPLKYEEASKVKLYFFIRNIGEQMVKSAHDVEFFHFKLTEDTPEGIKAISRIKEELDGVKLEIKYEDLYGNEMPLLHHQISFLKQ